MLEWITNLFHRRPRLSAEQVRALAHELNRPIIEPLLHPPPGFQSKLKFAAQDLAPRIRGIDWFSACGREVSAAVSVPYTRLANWDEAIAACSAQPWEDAELEAQNQLTIWLSLHSRNDYQAWNDHVDAYKAELLFPHVQPKVTAYTSARGFPKGVLDSVNWCILGALMENKYLYTGHQVLFFLELLLLYEEGHFPCGWEGEWPEGKLLVL